MTVLKIDEKKKSLVIVAAAIVIILSLVFVVIGQFFLGPQVGKVNETPYNAMAEVLAIETVKAVGGKGEIVVVLRKTKDPVKKDQLDTFLAAVKKGGLSVMATEIVDNEVITRAMGEGENAHDVGRQIVNAPFLEASKKHTGVAAVVAFDVQPDLTDEEITALGKDFPKVILAAESEHDLKRLFEKQVVQLAVVGNPLGGILEKNPKTSQEWFDSFYKLVTPSNIATLFPNSTGSSQESPAPPVPPPSSDQPPPAPVEAPPQTQSPDDY